MQAHEHDNAATCLRACASSLLRQSSLFDEVGSAKAGDAAGGPFSQTQGILFQHSYLGWWKKGPRPLSFDALDIHQVIWRTQIGHEFGINPAMTDMQ